MATLGLKPRPMTPLVLSSSLCFMKDQRMPVSFQKTYSQNQPTSSREPFTHSVSDVKRQPLGGAPRGQVLATDIALFGDVLIWTEYLQDRERGRNPRPWTESHKLGHGAGQVQGAKGNEVSECCFEHLR